MSLIYNGTNIENVTYNSTALEKVIDSGVEVWDSGVPITFVEGSNSTTIKYRKGSTVTRGSDNPSNGFYTFVGWTFTRGNNNYVTSFIADVPKTVYRVCRYTTFDIVPRTTIPIGLSRTSFSQTTKDDGAMWGYYIAENITYPVITGAYSVTVNLSFDFSISENGYASYKLYFCDADKKTITYIRDYTYVSHYNAGTTVNNQNMAIYNPDYTNGYLTGEGYEKYLSGKPGKLGLFWGKFSEVATVNVWNIAVSLYVTDRSYYTAYTSYN